MEQIKTKRTQKKTEFPTEKIKSILLPVTAAGVGFLLNGACIVQSIRPFSTAFVSATTFPVTVWAALGTALGSIVFTDTVHALKYACAACLTALLRYALSRLQWKNEAAVCACCAVLGLIPCAIALEVAVGTDAAGLVLCMAEAVLSGAASLLTGLLIGNARRGHRRWILTERDSAAVLLAAGIFLLAMQPISPYGFPVGNLFSALIILLWGYCGGETGSCLAGVCCGAVAGLADDGAFTALSGAVGGLLAGICMPAGRIAGAAGYCAACFLTLVTNGVTGNPVLYAFSAVAGSVLFIFIPDTWIDRMTGMILPNRKDNPLRQAGKIYADRLHAAGNAVRHVSDAVANVSDLLAGYSLPSAQETARLVRCGCCGQCPQRVRCWEKELSGMRSGFSAALRILEKEGRLTAENLPEKLSVLCINPAQLTDCFNRSHTSVVRRRARMREVYTAKALAAGQLRTAAWVLEDLAKDDEIRPVHPAILPTVDEILHGIGLEPQDIRARTDRDGHLFLRAILTEKPSDSLKKQIAVVVSDKIGVSFAPAVILEESGNFILCLYEKTNYEVRTAWSRLPCANENGISGDSLTGFPDGCGNYYLLLSDGMGTGQRAALDSLMTNSLTASLLKGGVSPSCSIGLVNAALLLRCGEESMATLDIAAVDLYTGQTHLYKAGAACSVLHNAQGMTVIEQQTLPLGILEETDVSCNSFRMEDGDILLLVSDGALPLPESGLRTFFAGKEGHSLQRLVRGITSTAEHACHGHRGDDVTAAALMLVHSK